MRGLVFSIAVLPLLTATNVVYHIHAPTVDMSNHLELRAANSTVGAVEGANKLSSENSAFVSNILTSSKKVAGVVSEGVKDFANKEIKTTTGEFYEESHPIKSVVFWVIHAACVGLMLVVLKKVYNRIVQVVNGSRWGVDFKTIDDVSVNLFQEKLPIIVRFKLWVNLILLQVAAEMWLAKQNVNAELLRPTLKIVISFTKHLLFHIDDIGSEVKEVLCTGIKDGWQSRNFSYLINRNGRILGDGIAGMLISLSAFSNEHQSVCSQLAQLVDELDKTKADGLVDSAFRSICGIWHINFVSVRASILKRLLKYIDRMSDYASKIGNQNALKDTFLARQIVDIVRSKFNGGKSANIYEEMNRLRDHINDAGAEFVAYRKLHIKDKKNRLPKKNKRTNCIAHNRQQHLSVLGRVGRFSIRDSKHGYSIYDISKDKWYKKTGNGRVKEMLTQFLDAYRAKNPEYIVPLGDLEWQSAFIKIGVKEFCADQLEIVLDDREGSIGRTLAKGRIRLDK